MNTISTGKYLTCILTLLKIRLQRPPLPLKDTASKNVLVPSKFMFAEIFFIEGTKIELTLYELR